MISAFGHLPVLSNGSSMRYSIAHYSWMVAMRYNGSLLINDGFQPNNILMVMSRLLP